MTVALVRPPGRSFRAALSSHPEAATIDLAEAIRQHGAYVAALRRLGVEVVPLPPEDALPDACFIEDCAVAVGRDALLTNLLAPTRAPEPATVAPALAERVGRLTRMPDGAALDGGDVLHIGTTYFVGRSSRTNGAGIGALAAFARDRGADVVPVDVPPGYLHLRTAVTAYSDRGLVGVAEALAAPAFGDVPDKLAVPPGEAPAANVLRVGRAVVMAAGCPATARRLRGAGCDVVELPLSEFTKADAGPTCLSLRIA